MILEIHDNETGNTLTGRINDIDYDYQAEQWVQDLWTDEVKREKPFPFQLTKFVLIDESGQRAVWTVIEGGIALTEKSDRFEGTWSEGSVFSPQVDAEFVKSLASV